MSLPREVRSGTIGQSEDYSSFQTLDGDKWLENSLMAPAN